MAQSPVLAPIINSYPHGNRTLSSTTSQYVSVGSVSANEDSGLVRIDHRINDSTNLFARYNLDQVQLASPTGNLLDKMQTSTSPKNAAINLSHVFSSSMFNVLQLGMNRIWALTHTVNTKWNIRFSPLVNIQSGPPFDITTGSDLYGTTLFNARPGIDVPSGRAGLISTSSDLRDPNPTPGEALLSRNYGRGPGQMSVNFRVGKTIPFGPEQGKAGTYRYNATISLSARNLLNHTNPGPIIGDITSPLFGRANQVAGSANGEGFSENASNRRLEMQIRFTF